MAQVYAPHEIPAGVPSPLLSLTAAQQDLMEKLRAIVVSWNLAEAENKFVDDMCLFRYLKGLKWDLSVASHQLKETVDWRAEYKPEQITLNDVKEVAQMGHMYQCGFDKLQRPIIYLQLTKDKLSNDVEDNRTKKFKYVVYMMEKTIAVMPPGIYQVTWVIDLKDSDLSIAAVKATKNLFGQLGNYYTERLGRAFVLNSPWTFSMIWSIISAFLVKETVEKYQFAKGSAEEVSRKIKEFVEDDQLIQAYLGSKQYNFDLNNALAAEVALASTSGSSSSAQPSTSSSS